MRVRAALKLLVQVHSDEYSEEGQQIHLERKPDRQLKQHQIQGQRRIDARGDGGGKDVLNGSASGVFRPGNYTV